MDSWNVYPQNTPGTPNSTFLCPQNNLDWCNPQHGNVTTERERNENAALATPTRFIVEYNDANQNSSSGSYYNLYTQMDKLFDNNFLKIGNPEELLNDNNNLSSWNENVVPINNDNSMTTITNVQNTNSNTNSPTPSLVTDDDQDQLYNDNNLSEHSIQNPVTTSADSYVQYFNNENHHHHHHHHHQILTTIPTTTSNSNLANVTQPKSSSSSPTSFYQSDFNNDNRGQYLKSKKHDPKQLLLPLTTGIESMDGTMTLAITSPTSSLCTDDDNEVNQFHQIKSKNRRNQSSYQDFSLSISTDDLPMQQPSPVSSDNKTPPPSNETTPKQKKRRISQRKTTNKKNEGALISPIEKSYLDQDLITNTTITTIGQEDLTKTIVVSESSKSSSNKNTGTSNSSSTSTSNSTIDSYKRDIPDDGHDNEESPEEKRSRLLERNRIAAAKCRQKKKQAQECLQQQASELTQKNTTMHALVNDLREEALKLKNRLLAHSTCNCNVIQEYVRTSGQFAFARGTSYSK